MRLARIATLFILTLVCASASASTVLKMDVDELVAHSDRAVIGVVSDKVVYEEEGRILTAVTVEVHETVFGPKSDEVTIVQYGGRYKDRVTYVPGMPQFEVGERVLLFLEITKQNPMPDFFVVTGMTQGKFRIALSPDGKTPYAIPTLTGVSLVRKTVTAKGNTTLKPTAASDVHKMAQPLDALKKQIERAVSAR